MISLKHISGMRNSVLAWVRSLWRPSMPSWSKSKLAQTSFLARVDLIRRAIVHRFPYGIFFVTHSEFINVIAVMHHARDPKHWRIRAKDNR